MRERIGDQSSRRISFSQAQYAQLDDYVARIREKAMEAHYVDDPHQALKSMVALTNALYRELKDGVIE